MCSSSTGASSSGTARRLRCSQSRDQRQARLFRGATVRDGIAEKGGKFVLESSNVQISPPSLTLTCEPSSSAAAPSQHQPDPLAKKTKTHLLSLRLLLLYNLVLFPLDRLLLLRDGLNLGHLDRLARVPCEIVLDPERCELRALGLLALEQALLDRLLLLVRLGLWRRGESQLLSWGRTGDERTAARLTRSARPLGTGLNTRLAPIQSLGWISSSGTILQTRMWPERR